MTMKRNMDRPISMSNGWAKPPSARPSMEAAKVCSQVSPTIKPTAPVMALRVLGLGSNSSSTHWVMRSKPKMTPTAPRDVISASSSFAGIAEPNLAAQGSIKRHRRPKSKVHAAVMPWKLFAMPTILLTVGSLVEASTFALMPVNTINDTAKQMPKRQRPAICCGVPPSGSSSWPTILPQAWKRSTCEIRNPKVIVMTSSS
mmetsp:Transcript_44035/g.111495  ORF Transcript_44035/g.111495 Transcript_44035/m.111495 type:complete len:201 (+) Transcript_44035:307-909(+)